MNAHTPLPHEPAAAGTNMPHRGIDLPAAVVISWSLAGGMLFGGAAVVLMLITDRLSGHLMLTASATLFALGALIGLAHGVALGIFGRPDRTTVRQAWAAIVHGLLYLVPSLLLGWLLAGWVAAMPMALSGKHLIATAISALAWLVMIVTIYFAGSIGLKAAQLAFARWPHRAVGTVLVSATLVALVASFLVQPPTLWPFATRLTTEAALLFALLATIWFFGPVITVGLWLVKRFRPGLREAALPSGETLKRAGISAAIAVASGLALAVIALPFYRGALHLPSDAARLGVAGALLMALSDAFTNELFFRLFVMTVAFVLAARIHATGARAAVLAIAAAAVLDLLFHLRGVPALGLPGAGSLIAFAVVRLAIPSIAFGYLFWKRGLATAVGAHLTAGAALGLLAL